MSINNNLKIGVFCFLLLNIQGVLAEPGVFISGVHFKELANPPSEVVSNRIEVVEMLWYGCGTCFLIQPFLESWRERHQENINFVRMPAVTDKPDMALHAKIFFTAQKTGVLDQIHQPLFQAIHRYHRRLNSEMALFEFLEESKVNVKKFKRVFQSKKVSEKVIESRQLGSQFGIIGTPSIIIGKRYLVDASMVTGPKQLIAVMDYLLSKTIK